MKVSIMSFGFDHIPPKVDWIFDARHIYWIPTDESLYQLNGTDSRIQASVMEESSAQAALNYVFHTVRALVAKRRDEGYDQTIIGIGCHAGWHRSVTLAERFHQLAGGTHLLHRDINRPWSDPRAH